MKRFLSLMLAFILVFGMLPANSVTAMADKKDKYDYENGEIIKINWQRTKEGRGNTLTINKSSRLKWNWSLVPQRLTNFGETVWDGSTNNSFIGLKVGHSSATWKNEPRVKDQSTFRRFRGTFEIPKGYTSKDQIVVSSVAQSLYNKYGNIIPINDDIFIFVYKDGESIDNRNFMDYLAFWTGTSNQNGITTFNGVRGTDTVWLNSDGRLPSNHPLKHTDGWYCEADYDNIGDSLYKNYPDAKEGEKFVIDVITSDYAGTGGMDELKISIGKLTDKAVTIKYYEGSVEDGKEIHSVSRKNLKAGEKINLSSGELNIAKDKLSNKDIFGDGIQVGGEYTVGYDKEQVIKVYYPLKAEQKYKVEHYLMDKDGIYSSSPTVETKTGKLGENAEAVPKEYTHHKLDENNQNNITQGQITAPEQLVLKLYYAREQYKVSYNANVPETETIAVPKDETVYAETEITISDAPVRNGYTFKGWDTEKINSDDKVYSPKDKFVAKSDVTLYAQWEKDNIRWHKVIYDANGGTGSQKDENEYLAGTDVNVLGKGEISREHHIFDSWNTQSDGKGRKYREGEKITAISSGVTLYAQWREIDKFTLSYNSNGGVEAAPPSVTVYDGENVDVASDILTRVGFKRDGWNTSPDAKGIHYADGAEFKLTKNIELFAQWNKTDGIWHKVSYEANLPEGIAELTSGQLPIDENEYLVGDGAVISENDMKLSGYTFTGWKAENDETIYNVGSLYSVRGEKDTLYAQWQKAEGEWFNVIYDANGGKNEPKTAEYLAGTRVTVAEKGEMSKVGFTFDGWTDGSVDYEVGEKFTMPNSHVTLKAKWAEIQGKISITHRYFTNGSFDGETADENVEVGYQFSITNFLKALFNSIRYEARVSEIKVERRLIEKAEDEVALESIPQEIKAEVTEKPSEEAKPEEATEKPSEEAKPEEATEKPSEEVKPDEVTEKPSEEAKPDEATEKPSEEAKPEDTTEKPSEEAKPDEATEKPSEEVKSEDTTEKPSEETKSDVGNEVEVLAGVSEDLNETIVELKEKESEVAETEETVQEAKSEEKLQEKPEEAVKEELKSEWETVNGDSGNYIFEEGYEYRVIINYYRTTSSSGGGGSHHRPSHRPSGGDTDKTVTISDEEVPLSQSPELFTIVDEEVPLGKLPKTGGNSLSITATVAAVAILSSSLKKKFGKNRK